MTVYVLTAVLVTSSFWGNVKVSTSDPIAFDTAEDCYKSLKFNRERHHDGQYQIECTPVKVIIKKETIPFVFR